MEDLPPRLLGEGLVMIRISQLEEVRYTLLVSSLDLNALYWFFRFTYYS
jgi:hypothetical protein